MAAEGHFPVALATRANVAPVVVFVGLSALAFALYAPVLDDWFISDDLVLVRFVRTWGGSWVDFLVPSRTFSDPIVQSRYKPFFVYLLAAEDLVFGDGVVGRHCVNVVLHALVGTAAFVLGRQLTGSPGAALTAAVLFVATRLHSQAVTWVSSTFRLLSVALVAWGVVALIGLPRRVALVCFGLAGAAALLTNPEVVVVVPLVGLLALYFWRGPRRDGRRAITLSWATALLAVLAAAYSAGNWVSLRHFPDQDFAAHPRPERFLFIFLDLVVPYAVPLGLKLVVLLAVLGAAVLVARKDPLPALMLLAATPGAVLWTSIGAYPLSPRHLYWSAFPIALALGLLVWRAVGRSPRVAGALVMAFVLGNGVAMWRSDFVLLEGRAVIGERLRAQQLQARVAGERRRVWVPPPLTLTPADLAYFRPELELVAAPGDGVHVVDSGEAEYVARVGPDYARLYWPWTWFASISPEG